MTKEKSLSQQLCELCGVKAKIIPCPHKGCRNHITHPCKVCNNKRFIEVYPDFENPENFVKLLELQHKNSINGISNVTFVRKVSFVEQYLQDIIYNLKTYTDDEYFKQAIRDYNGWVWG